MCVCVCVCVSGPLANEGGKNMFDYRGEKNEHGIKVRNVGKMCTAGCEIEVAQMGNA